MFEQPPSPDKLGPILVIDDEPYILRSLSYLLAREGYTVEPRQMMAARGEEPRHTRAA